MSGLEFESDHFGRRSRAGNGRPSAALLVIDLQNDFCHPCGFFGRASYDTTGCQAVLPRVLEAVGIARAMSLLIVWTRTVVSEGAGNPFARRARAERDELCDRTGVGREGTWGASFVEGCDPRSDEIEIHKQTYDAFHRTVLEDRLRERGVQFVVLCGVTTNACVDSTLRGAFSRGFDVVLLQDAVAAFEADLHEAVLRNTRLLFGSVVRVDSMPDVVSELTSRVLN